MTEQWMDVAMRPDLHDAPVQRKNAADESEQMSLSLPASGQPLPEDVQAKMEGAFGTDFSAVRIHEGRHAEAVGALAYTQGTDIHFAPGQYQPQSQRGQELLGHELTHVVQQSQGRVQATTQAKGVDINDDASLEREADIMGKQAANGQRVDAAALALPAPAPAGVVQRMIDKDVPDVGGDDTEELCWPRASLPRVLIKFMVFEVVNSRGQTFEDAVGEFVRLYPQNQQVVDLWKQAKSEVLNLTDRGPFYPAYEKLVRIRQHINDHETTTPSHPNKRGISPDREAPGTVPQSELSRGAAARLREDLLRSLVKPRDHDEGEHGYWAEKYMLGVLVLPSGQIRVAHSGFMGPTQQARFDDIVRGAKYEPISYDEKAYATLQQHYSGHLKGEIREHSDRHEIEQEQKHPRTVDKARDKVTGEVGNPAGVCAAAQVIGYDVSKLPRHAMIGKEQMALTEVWVSNNQDSRVSIFDADEEERRYRGDKDVPSCLTCQIQLLGVLAKLRAHQRYIDVEDGVLADDQRPGLDITVSPAEYLDRAQALLELSELPELSERALKKANGDKKRRAKARAAVNEAMANYQKVRQQLIDAMVDNPAYFADVDALVKNEAIASAEAERQKKLDALIKKVEYAEVMVRKIQEEEELARREAEEEEEAMRKAKEKEEARRVEEETLREQKEHAKEALRAEQRQRIEQSREAKRARQLEAHRKNEANKKKASEKKASKQKQQQRTGEHEQQQLSTPSAAVLVAKFMLLAAIVAVAYWVFRVLSG
jgi:hypothetical protein